MELYLHSSNTSSWHGTQLKHRDNFTLSHERLETPNASTVKNVLRSKRQFPVVGRALISYICEIQNNRCNVLHAAQHFKAFEIYSAEIPWTEFRASWEDVYQAYILNKNSMYFCQ
jgi:hypothetical protein